MKRLIILAGIITISIMLWSCSDSLGIDPAVQVTLTRLGDSVGDDSPGQYRIDSIYLKTTENYEYGMKQFSWDTYSINYDIKIDTSRPKIKFWFTIDVQSPLLIKSDIDRKDYISKFKIKYRGILKLNETISLSGADNSWNYAMIVFNTIGMPDSKEYYGPGINASITIDKIDTQKKIITGLIAIKPVENIYNTISISSSFEIYYRNN